MHSTNVYSCMYFFCIIERNTRRCLIHNMSVPCERKVYITGIINNLVNKIRLSLLKDPFLVWASTLLLLLSLGWCRIWNNTSLYQRKMLCMVCSLASIGKGSPVVQAFLDVTLSISFLQTFVSSIPIARVSLSFNFAFSEIMHLDSRILYLMLAFIRG